MPETVSKGSPGVAAREIDNSQVTDASPVGVPAGIIGTAASGPAFVPITVQSYSEFKSKFGASDGKRFGPLAVNEWLRSSDACTYVRVLGIGDGTQRNNDGSVTRAGFVVGGNLPQDNGNTGRNTFAFERNAAGTNFYAPTGRTYFLGCFMSESNGSTFLSDAGVQKSSISTGVKATAVDAIDTTSVANNTLLQFFVPAAAGGETDNSGVTEVFLDANQTTNPTEGANRIAVGSHDSQSDDEIAAQIIHAINGTVGANVDPASSGNGQTDGVKGITASVGSTSTKITLTIDVFGIIGNDATITDTGTGAHNIVDVGAFTGGASGNRSVPIVRGVLMVPSGVIAHLSGNIGPANYSNHLDTSVSAVGTEIKGAMTGSVKKSDGTFSLILNGMINESKRIKKLSFNPNHAKYFGAKGVLNQDPDKIESEGHYLYTHYDIPSSIAVVTGSGIIPAGNRYGDEDFEPIGFLLTGSIARNTGGSGTPDYEAFDDRFNHAFTTFFTSQNFGGTRYNLFRLHALSPGDSFSKNYKVSIEDIQPSTDTNNKYGKFSLVIRRIDDNDLSVDVIERFTSLSLDPESSDYIARKIGDRNLRFNFDDTLEAQKIVEEGEYANRSSLIRVEVSNAVANKTSPAESLPVGFRGLYHLVTSGSSPLAAFADEAEAGMKERFLKSAKQPPVKLVESVNFGEGEERTPDNRIYWGVQTFTPNKSTRPNFHIQNFDETIYGFNTWFPNHRTGQTNMWVGGNEGADDTAALGVVDADRFNNNFFSLENIRVRTGSDGLADPDYWMSASYVRNGNISTDDAEPSASKTGKSRAFQVSDLGNAVNRNYLKFTNIFQGGWNGVDIFTKNRREFEYGATKYEIDNSNTMGGTSGPVISAYRKAIDVLSNIDDATIKVMAVPGQRHPAVVDYAIDAVENRFDSILIADIEQYDNSNLVMTGSGIPSVKNTVNNFKNRVIDSSFAAAYFPDVTIVDPDTNGNILAPPSVSVLGAYSLNDQEGFPWFAPAGINRGTLQNAVKAKVTLTKNDSDLLYDARINPIREFIGSSVVVYGQKTLQVAESALDRVNVRRLLIEIRRRVRQVANTIIFEPNRDETLRKFSSLVNPILQSIQDQSGLDRFKVVIDSSTTTQADVENNTIRGKIYVQPTRTAEFIQLDFQVSNNGAIV